MANYEQGCDLSGYYQAPQHYNKVTGDPIFHTGAGLPSQGLPSQANLQSVWNHNRVMTALRNLQSNGVDPETVMTLVHQKSCRQDLQTIWKEVRDGFSIQQLGNVVHLMINPHALTDLPLSTDRASCSSNVTSWSGLTARDSTQEYSTLWQDHSEQFHVDSVRENLTPRGADHDTSEDMFYHQQTLLATLQGHDDHVASSGFQSPYSDIMLWDKKASDSSLQTAQLFPSGNDAEEHSNWQDCDVATPDEPDRSLIAVELPRNIHHSANHVAQLPRSRSDTVTQLSSSLMDHAKARVNRDDCPNYSVKLQPRNEASAEWKHYKVPGSKVRARKTHCPLCSSRFEAPKEFAKHMVAEHDQPTKFYCAHSTECSYGATSLCDFETWRWAQFKKHHTERHEDCKIVQTSDVLPQSCHYDVNKDPAKKAWGCFCCNHIEYNVDGWVAHHMTQHSSCSRKDMSYTWLIKSLLSQKVLQQWWQKEISLLEESTSYVWDIKWSEEPDHATRKLITALESGFYDGEDMDRNQGAQQGVVKFALDAAASTRAQTRPVAINQRNITKRHATSPPCMTQSGKLPVPRYMRSQRSKPDLQQVLQHSATTESRPCNASQFCMQDASSTLSELPMRPVPDTANLV